VLGQKPAQGLVLWLGPQPEATDRHDGVCRGRGQHVVTPTMKTKAKASSSQRNRVSTRDGEEDQNMDQFRYWIADGLFRS
jgi:hypothetical protein